MQKLTEQRRAHMDDFKAMSLQKNGIPLLFEDGQILASRFNGGGTTEQSTLTEIESMKSQLLVFARSISDAYQRQRSQSNQLEQLTAELRNTYLDVVRTLAFVVEAKDEYTRHHLERSRQYGIALAEIIEPSMVTPEIEYGFLLHDVGKIGISETILSKPSPLSTDEMRVMMTHPLIGVQIVAPMRFLDTDAMAVIRHHHERFDGSGYPDRLSGEEIPKSARVFSVVDAFDAMTTDRPYRGALSIDEALDRLHKGAGTQFDPEIVGAFKDLMGSSSPP